MICFSCPSCKQTLEVEERGAGLIVPCPTCGTQVTIPWKVQPVVVKTAKPSTTYNPLDKLETEVPPVVHAGVICLCIFSAVSLVGLILLHSQLQSILGQFQQLSAITPATISSLELTMQNPITMEVQVLPAVFWLQSIFGTVALICAIVAMATDHVNKGLALLIGTAVMIALLYLALGKMSHDASQEVVNAVNQQSIEMQQQLQKMLLPPSR